MSYTQYPHLSSTGCFYDPQRISLQGPLPRKQPSGLAGSQVWRWDPETSISKRNSLVNSFSAAGPWATPPAQHLLTFRSMMVRFPRSCLNVHGKHFPVSIFHICFTSLSQVSRSKQRFLASFSWVFCFHFPVTSKSFFSLECFPLPSPSFTFFLTPDLLFSLSSSYSSYLPCTAAYGAYISITMCKLSERQGPRLI